MFDFLTNAIENALDVTLGIATGELPTKRKVAELIGDGISIAVIAHGFGVAEDVITDLLDQ